MNKKKANKIEILKILKQKEIVSGKVIAQQLGISRTAVWKHIKSLIRKGYLIKISKKGYRLVESNNSLCEEEFSELPIKVYCFEKVTSTMDIARKLLQKTEKKEEVLILAETQTYGRGRLGRTWISPPGGIWMSLIINPDLDLKSSFILTYVASLATALSIEENTGIKVSLKWPNDILYQEKKLGGILLEIQAEPDKLKNAILGIGINANNFISSLEKGAISLKEILNQEIDRKKIIVKLIENIKVLLTSDIKKVLSMWKKRSSTLNQKVKIITSDKEFIGEAIDIAEDGALVLKTEKGFQKVYSGDCIHLRNLS